VAIRIPVHSTAATHCTDGLSGYPAIDFMGSLGEDVFIGEGGMVVDPHLIPWHEGFGGWTFYFYGDSLGHYFVTHLDEGFQIAAGRVEAGALVGHLTRSATHAALINGAHVHVGNTTWSGPGLNCGTAAGTTGAPAKPPVHRTTPRVIHPPSGPTGPTGEPVKLNPFTAWKHLTGALGSTIPTQDQRARAASNLFMRAVR
jgi:hypothetical protein